MACMCFLMETAERTVKPLFEGREFWSLYAHQSDAPSDTEAIPQAILLRCVCTRLTIPCSKNHKSKDPARLFYKLVRLSMPRSNEEKRALQRLLTDLLSKTGTGDELAKRARAEKPGGATVAQSRGTSGQVLTRAQRDFLKPLLPMSIGQS